MLKQVLIDIDNFALKLNHGRKISTGCPGLEELKNDFRKNDIQVQMKNQRTGDIPLAECLLITDDQSLAVQYKNSDLLVIGVQKEGDTSYFDGAEVVIHSCYQVDASFFMTIYARYHGLSVLVCETPRLLIRESREEDFEALYQMSTGEEYCFPETKLQDNHLPADRLRESHVSADNAEETILTGIRLTGDMETEREKFLAYLKWTYDFFDFGLWTVTLKDGTIIGRCGLCPVNDDFSVDGRIELGYLIAKSYRKQGYAREACEAILDFARDRLELPEVWITIHEKNQVSRHLAQTLGFQLTFSQVPDSQLQRYRRSLI